MSNKVVSLFGIVIGLVLWAFIVSKSGILGLISIGLLPFFILLAAGFFKFPKIGIFIALAFSFAVSFLNRLIPGVPFGLGVDAILILTAAATFFHFWTDLKSEYLRSPITWGFVIWSVYILLQLANPLAPSRAAWFYAMRGMALYPLLTILLGLALLRSPKDIKRFLLVWLGFSVFGALYGIKQQFFGVFGFEQQWLDAGAAVQHVLFGKLRIFSFYSDAGQFGPAMAHTALVSGLLFLSMPDRRNRWIMLPICLLSFYAMLISGTRGALAVPFFGGLVYLILIKNFRVLAIGVISGILIFSFLKYTTIGNGNYEINRLRTALDPNNPSLLVRLNNQARLKTYMADKPFGGGVGSAGSWGERFSPGTFLAEFPTDSLYVAIRAETGVVGLYLFLLSIFGPLIWAFVRIFQLPEHPRRPILVAFLSGVFGILGASYGNSVLTQMPTSFITYFSIIFIFATLRNIRSQKISASETSPLESA